MSLKKRIVPLCLAVLILGALAVPTPAQAAPFVGAAHCRVVLDLWPTTQPQANSTNCVGTVLAGVGFINDGNPDPDVCGAPACPFEATIDSYNEPCVSAGGQFLPGPPPVGFANGRLFVNATDIGGYNWVRVGVTAVLLPIAPGTTAGVAAFEPIGTTPTCSAPGQLTADVFGVAVSPS